MRPGGLAPSGRSPSPECLTDEIITITSNSIIIIIIIMIINIYIYI